jgi:endonuclease III
LRRGNIPKAQIDTSQLVIPLDTHIHKLSRNIGLTLRKAADFRAAEEITVALARLDPRDPTKYDFSLCHLGMVQSCPSRKDENRCTGCGVKPVCRHWHVAKRSNSISSNEPPSTLGERP